MQIKEGEFLAEVVIKWKSPDFDAEGKAKLADAHSKGYAEVTGVDSGKIFEIRVKSESRALAAERIRCMCEELLANSVIENFGFTVHGREDFIALGEALARLHLEEKAEEIIRQCHSLYPNCREKAPPATPAMMQVDLKTWMLHCGNCGFRNSLIPALKLFKGGK